MDRMIERLSGPTKSELALRTDTELREDRDVSYSPGEVLRVTLDSGAYAYIQYTSEGSGSSIVRLLPGVFTTELENESLADLAHQPGGLRIQADLYECTDNVYAKVVGTFEVPSDQRGVPAVRLGLTNNIEDEMVIDTDGSPWMYQEFTRFHPEVDVISLPTKRIPMSLMWKLNQITGQASETTVDQQSTARGRYGSEHFCYFDHKVVAEVAAGQIRSHGIDVVVRQAAGNDLEWLVLSTHFDAEPSEDEDLIKGITERHGGTYDGHGSGLLP